MNTIDIDVQKVKENKCVIIPKSMERVLKRTILENADRYERMHGDNICDEYLYETDNKYFLECHTICLALSMRIMRLTAHNVIPKINLDETDKIWNALLRYFAREIVIKDSYSNRKISKIKYIL